MDYLQLMKERHSVRSYKDEPLKDSVATKLEDKIKEVNKESGLSFKLVLDEPKAFGGMIPKYGIFKGVKNYIICSGPKVDNFDEKIGYYGEELVIYTQSLGLNTFIKGK